MHDLLHMYRERNGNPGFWAEPLNAFTNLAFLLAAIAAWSLARRRQALTEATWTLIVLAACIGTGSFLFHTCATAGTMWLDIIPIALFQVLFFWLSTRCLLRLSVPWSLGIVVSIIGLSFLAMPVRQPLNGSLFYLPALTGTLVIGGCVSRRRPEEPWLLPMAGLVFAVAILARSIDKTAPLAMGTHFVWHLLNGLVLYLAMRAWILHVSSSRP